MTSYNVRVVHRIAPSDNDVLPLPVAIPDGAFADRKTLAAALRAVGVLPSGGRLQTFRVEGDRVVAFPQTGVWHAIVLTAVQA